MSDLGRLIDHAHDDLVEHVFANAVLVVEPRDLARFFAGVHDILTRRMSQAARSEREQLVKQSEN